MFFFTFEATPDPEGEFALETGGAYVNCWVSFKRGDGAEVLARHYIREAGWIPVGVTQSLIVSRENYAEDEETLGYFAEAEEDGVCLVFYQFEQDDEADNAAYTASRTFQA